MGYNMLNKYDTEDETYGRAENRNTLHRGDAYRQFARETCPPRGAAELLTDVDIIAAEDTRRSMVLLGKLEIRNKLVSNHKFNEYGKAKYFINEMKAGKSVAVITDAGTPCISDPGNELIKAAVEEGIRVVGVPGCCAAVNALAISGFDLSSFLFYGFFRARTPTGASCLKKCAARTRGPLRFTRARSA